MNRKEFFGLLDEMSAGELLQVQTAYWLSKNAHRVQKPRDTGERYFEHPREVAIILIEYGYKDKNTITKALLHDVVEDTNTPTEVIVNLFGHDIWRSLVVLSKVMPVFDPVTGQIQHRYKKLDEQYYGELALALTPDQLVKLADRLHNLRTIQVWDKAKQVRYAQETQKYLLPIAKEVDARFEQALLVEINRILET